MLNVMDVPIDAEVWASGSRMWSHSGLLETSLVAPSWSVQIITGRKAILALQEFLVELGARYEQKGAMDHLEYFMTSASSLKKTPHLVLIGKNQELAGADAREAVCALLIYEYRVLGCGTGVFSTEDRTGRRTLVAPADARMLVARLAAEALMRRGAKMTVQSVLEVAEIQRVSRPMATPKQQNDWKSGTRQRTIPSFLALQATMDATLATLGQKTRSNLRYYRRRAEAQLGSEFVEHVEISKAEFKAFNRECSFAAEDSLAVWRYEALMKLPGMFLCGIKGADGQWLSMIGGRRHHDMVEIDWQMNRDDLPAYSLSTVMRSYFMEHEISLGMKKMFIEGGTPHSIKYSFVTEKVKDIVLVRSFWMLSSLRRVAKRVLPKANFVTAILAKGQIKWLPWSCG